MRPETQSITLLGVTRARAKMHEYEVPQDQFNSINKDPQELLFLTIRILGSLDEDKPYADARADMLFAAQYFDSYVSSRLGEDLNEYLLLLGSAAYYLCDLPGSSIVLAKRIGPNMWDIESGGLEFLLRDLLINNVQLDLSSISDQSYQKTIIISYLQWCSNDTSTEALLGVINSVRRQIYNSGSDRELLMVDTIFKVIRKRVKNSTIERLPKFTGVDLERWSDIIGKPTFIREFWPSQILLGEKGIFRGASSVIQMPTSAGKTRSIEIILRSSLLANRTKLAVIVAPFRSLCNEIKITLQEAFRNESVDIDAPSDAMQFDFGLEDDRKSNFTVLIVTPEKLIYMIRHSREILERIGLLIYDEGHQFDNGTRGVTYELLLASLRQHTPVNAQIILISAVISNASQIGQWLIGDDSLIVDGVTLVPTYRTIGFVSWRDMQGRIEFVKAGEPDVDEFYVPRVLQALELNKKGRERKARYFPGKKDGKAIALALGLRLVKNGMVAIFCGAKTTVLGIARSIMDLNERGYHASWPAVHADQSEIAKLYHLNKAHFGDSYVLTYNCKLGIFAHTATTPTGIRHSVEYAAQNSLIKFIICTSTLAQGVNLPIRYLMVTSFYQASERIKTRDFHNLIGRAGRAGLHTEGSIIFTDPEIYDEKQFDKQDYKWNLAKQLLDPSKSEPCNSAILTIFTKLHSESRLHEITVSPIEIVRAYVKNPASINDIITTILDFHSDKNFTLASLTKQFSNKINIITSIESFLMSNWENANLQDNIPGVRLLAESTLGFATGTDDERRQLVELFSILAVNIQQKISDNAKKQSYGKTLIGVEDILIIEAWIHVNIQLLRSARDIEILGEIIWDFLDRNLKNHKLSNLLPGSTHYPLVENWRSGKSFKQLLESMPKDAYRKLGTRRGNIDIDFIIEVLDKTISYDGTLIIGAVAEVIRISYPNEDKLIRDLELLQKMLKYGLPSRLSIAFYELGFSDRIVSQELASAFPDFSTERFNLIEDIKRSKPALGLLLDVHPSYFTHILNSF